MPWGVAQLANQSRRDRGIEDVEQLVVRCSAGPDQHIEVSGVPDAKITDSSHGVFGPNARRAPITRTLAGNANPSRRWPPPTGQWVLVDRLSRPGDAAPRSRRTVAVGLTPQRMGQTDRRVIKAVPAAASINDTTPVSSRPLNSIGRRHGVDAGRRACPAADGRVTVHCRGRCPPRAAASVDRARSRDAAVAGSPRPTAIIEHHHQRLGCDTITHHREQLVPLRISISRRRQPQPRRLAGQRRHSRANSEPWASTRATNCSSGAWVTK